MKFSQTHILFVGPLIQVFWSSSDIHSGFQNQGGLTCMLFVTVCCSLDSPLVWHLLMASMTAHCIPYMLGRVQVGGQGSNGWSSDQPIDTLPNWQPLPSYITNVIKPSQNGQVVKCAVLRHGRSWVWAPTQAIGSSHGSDLGATNACGYVWRLQVHGSKWLGCHACRQEVGRCHTRGESEE